MRNVGALLALSVSPRKVSLRFLLCFLFICSFSFLVIVLVLCLFSFISLILYPFLFYIVFYFVFLFRSDAHVDPIEKQYDT